MFRHVISIVLLVFTVRGMLSEVTAICVLNFGLVVVRVESPKDLMRVSDADQQDDDQEESAMLEKPRHANR